MQLADFDYELPDELIARYPPSARRASRLLVLDPRRDELLDRRFAELPSFVHPDDLLVLNDTRVIKARLHGRKASGGRIEVLIERPLSADGALAQVRASKPPGSGSLLLFAGECRAEVTGRDGEFFRLRFSQPLLPFLERHGEVPLPPYLGRAAEAGDVQRYQTIYAREAGAVAAPTAGLHFDDALLAELDAAGVDRVFVTLHVGAGTFRNLRADEVEGNRLHSERVRVGPEVCAAVQAARDRGGRVIAVGTTSVRALETAAAGGVMRPIAGDTDLFIRPGHRFRAVDALLTNFHLPRSSLLLLVAAFAGTARVLDAYRHAVARGYRFFSYGDAMLIQSGNNG